MKHPLRSIVFAAAFALSAATSTAQKNSLFSYANFDHLNEGYGVSGGLGYQYSDRSIAGVNYNRIYTNSDNGRYVSHYNAAGCFMRLNRKIGRGKTFFWYMQPELIGFWSNAVDHRPKGVYHLRDRGLATGSSLGIGANLGHGLALNLDPVYLQFALGRITTDPSNGPYSYGDFALRVSPRIGLSFNARHRKKKSTMHAEKQ